MANQDFDFDPVKTSILSDGYMNYSGWWWQKDLPDKSIFPIDGGPKWEKGNIPEEYCYGSLPSVQGWKLHVAVHHDDIEMLYFALSPVLRRLQLAHKFRHFDLYRKQSESKAVAIYPETPAQIEEIVPRLDEAILRTRMKTVARNAKRGMLPDVIIRPHPNGVPGDLALGTTGFVYCRYGGFQGELANKNLLYDPNTKDTIADPRSVGPYPKFIKQVPDEIKKIIAPTSRFGSNVSELVSMKFQV